MAETPADELIPVLISFDAGRTFSQAERAAMAAMPKDERQTYAAREIVGFARQQQSAVLSLLRSAEQRGEAERVRSIEIANAIGACLTDKMIRAIAAQPGVRRIAWDRPLSPDQVSNAVRGSSSAEPGSAELAPILPLNPDPEWGVTKIRAPEVWAMGITGTGTLAAVLDKGCYYDHPDLASRLWDGLATDGTTQLWYDANGDSVRAPDGSEDLVHHGWDTVNNDNDPYQPEGIEQHGTQVAGIVLGDGTGDGGEQKQTGVAPEAILMCIQSNSGQLDEAGETARMEGFDFFVDMRAQWGSLFRLPDIVTMSANMRFSLQPDYEGWRHVTDAVLALGLAHTNSAGNRGEDIGGGCDGQGNTIAGLQPLPYNVGLPASAPPPWLHPDQPSPAPTGASHVSSANAVGATDSSDTIHSYSSRGPAAWEDIDQTYPCQDTIPPEFHDYPYPSTPLLKPDVVAPAGNGMFSTGCNDFGENGAPQNGSLLYCEFDGTSAAAPHVAGTVALMKQVAPDLTPAQVSEALQMSAVDLGLLGKDNVYGAGRIDAFAAVEYVLENLLPGDLVVPAGQTWSLGDLTVALAPGARVIVDGTLNATGTTFTARDSTQGWGGIVVFDTGALDLNGATVSRADVGITVLSTDVTVSGSWIEDNRVGIETGFVQGYCPDSPECNGGGRSAFTLRQSFGSGTFTFVRDNAEAGIRALNTNAIITDTAIRDNGTSTLNHHVGLGLSNATIETFERNVVEGSGSFGVAVIAGGDIEMSIPSPNNDYGYNRVANNGLAEVFVYNGGTAFLGSSTQNGRNSVYDDGGLLLRNTTSATVQAVNTYWDTLDPAAAGAFSGPVAFTPVSSCDYTVPGDPCIFSRAAPPGGLAAQRGASGPPAGASPDGGGLEPGLEPVLDESAALAETIRTLRAALAENPTAAAAPALVYELGALHRRDREDDLGEWPQTAALLGALRAPLAAPDVSEAERAVAEAALEVETVAALAREDYEAANDLITSWAPRAESPAVVGVLRLTEGHLAAQAGRYAEASALVESVAAAEPDADVQRELRAVAAAYARRAGDGGRGVSGTDASQTTSVAESPSEVTLAVFPNPTRSTATVVLGLREAGEVRAEVYDVLGRLVATLHDQELEAGRHQLRLETAKLPSGVYLVRAVVDDAAVTRRVTVLR